ncbi:MAG: hypothetical protein M1821_006954 [Bathelium mastoideum]|nr:MAG: hypothetical protein M1821_006954 [Bathelium mastoideum]
MQASTSAYLEAVKTRRSIYALNKNSPISDERIEQLFHEVILASPSAFNSQTTRAVLLLNEEHEKFWTMVAKIGENSGWPEEMLSRQRGRWEMFRKSKGSILLFESGESIEKNQKNYPATAKLFPEWSQHHHGIHAVTLWTTLEAEGLGANLQHNQMISGVDEETKKIWNLPGDWIQYAQLVFGGLESKELPPAKDKLPLTETTRTFDLAFAFKEASPVLLMRLTDRIQTVFDDDPEQPLAPEDIFDDALGSLFTDDVKDQYGHPSATILYNSTKYGVVKLKLADPDATEDWKLFAHFLWNAGLKMAVMVSQEDDWQTNQDNKGWQWTVSGETVLELGCGAGLPGMMSVLAGAQEVKLSDHPSASTAHLEHNLSTNIPPHLRRRISYTAHIWGDFYTSPRSYFPPSQASTFSINHPHRYTRVLAADTYWRPGQHANLARSMLHFLALEERARVLMTAGFHTGRRVLASWFETAEKEGLEVEEVWEEDGDGRGREWRVEREEGFEEEKRWMVVAVMKRRQR